MANFYRPKKDAALKGLSFLQKDILSLAKEQGGEVLARDVLIAHYKFKACCNPKTTRQGCLVFGKAQIGFARYNACTVAVCKAFNRLIERGLAIKIRSGIRLR
jgi:hypothetical protein